MSLEDKIEENRRFHLLTCGIAHHRYRCPDGTCEIETCPGCTGILVLAVQGDETDRTTWCDHARACAQPPGHKIDLFAWERVE